MFENECVLAYATRFSSYTPIPYGSGPGPTRILAKTSECTSSRCVIARHRPKRVTPSGEVRYPPGELAFICARDSGEIAVRAEFVPPDTDEMREMNLSFQVSASPAGNLELGDKAGKISTGEPFYLLSNNHRLLCRKGLSSNCKPPAGFSALSAACLVPVQVDGRDRYFTFVNDELQTAIKWPVYDYLACIVTRDDTIAGVTIHEDGGPNCSRVVSRLGDAPISEDKYKVCIWD